MSSRWMRPTQQNEKELSQGRLRIRKHAVLPAPFWLKYNRKKLPIRQYGEIFSADFISKIHWQNCFAPKKSKFCAELRRDGAGMLTHGKTAQRRSLCKICLLRRMFSYAESAKGQLFFCDHTGRVCFFALVRKTQKFSQILQSCQLAVFVIRVPRHFADVFFVSISNDERSLFFKKQKTTKTALVIALPSW